MSQGKTFIEQENNYAWNNIVSNKYMFKGNMEIPARILYAN